MLEKSAKTLDRLKIDWKEADKLPGEIISVRRMEWYLQDPDWTGDAITSVLLQLTIFTEVPILCKGHACDFAHSCPLVKAGSVDHFASRNALCPVEIVEAFRKFAGYINNLDIKPWDFIDIENLNALVRLQIKMRQIDMLLQKESPSETFVAIAVGQKEITQRKGNTLLGQQAELDARIQVIYKNLLATRQAKNTAVNAIRGSANISDILTVLQDKKKEKQQAALPIAVTGDTGHLEI